MNLAEYFENAKGRGVLASSDSEGKVNAAVYARPHVVDEQTVAFIMADRLTHHNLQSNPHAAYLFMEDVEGYEGKRLYLTKVREEKNSDLIESIRRRRYDDSEQKDRFLVHFHVDKVLPLIGAGDN